MHFMEGRSELGFGLWHELNRIFWRQHAAWMNARESANLAGMEEAWAGWKMARRDYLVNMWKGGCLVGTVFSAYVLTWKFKA